MADPISLLALVGGALSIGGGVAGAIGAKQTAAARNASIVADAAATRTNAAIARQNAQLEGIRMDEQLRQSRRKFQLFAGAQQAQAGALGMRDGSIQDLLADTNTQNEIERTGIIREGTMRQAGDLMTADALETRARGSLLSRTSGNAEAAGSLLGGIGGAVSIASRFHGLGGSGGGSGEGLYGPGF